MCVAVCCSVSISYIVVCCSVQWVAVCCSLLQCVTTCVAVFYSEWQSVVQWDAMSCSAFKRVLY